VDALRSVVSVRIDVGVHELKETDGTVRVIQISSLKSPSTTQPASTPKEQTMAWPDAHRMLVDGGDLIRSVCKRLRHLLRHANTRKPSMFMQLRARVRVRVCVCREVDFAERYCHARGICGPKFETGRVTLVPACLLHMRASACIL
jgi:hypothetical protein